MDGAAALVLVLSAMAVVMISCHQVCFIGSEYNPQSGIPPRWFLSYKDPCECTAIRLGGMRIPASSYRQGAPHYLKELFLSEDSDEIQAYFKCEPAEKNPAGTEKPIQAGAGIPTPAATEKPTTTVTEKPTSTVTENPTPAGTEKPTPVNTEKHTPANTEKPTPAGTEKPNPAGTEKPTPASAGKPTPAECSSPQPLGMEDGTIQDDRITASSSRVCCPASDGRLNNNNRWIPMISVNSWIEVDLVQSTVVSGVTTQGSGYGLYVTAYKVVYKKQPSSDREHVMDGNGNIKVFIGNTDRNTPVTNLFEESVVATVGRIEPSEWSGLDVALRLELLGCCRG